MDEWGKILLTSVDKLISASFVEQPPITLLQQLFEGQNGVVGRILDVRPPPQDSYPQRTHLV